MTLYHVHIYREMRLYFPGIEARTPEEAAAIAADRVTEDAACINDCDGENLAALIDVAGDDQYEHCVTIDFEAERHRKAAPELLEALIAACAWIDLHLAQLNGSRAGIEAIQTKVHASIGKATAIHNQPHWRMP
jgi:hypothetical protein